MTDVLNPLLETAGPLLADGAMGTMLFAAGLEFGDPPELWNLEHPDVVRRVHRGYIDAGSSVLLTNTFGGNRLRLELHGRESMVDELNRTAAVLAKVEAGLADRTVLVAGDIGPSGQIMANLGGTLTIEIAREAFGEQAAALAAGGVDLFWIETMSDLAEVTAAVEGVRDAAPGATIIATMSFDTRGHTMMGVSPDLAVRTLADLGVAAVGGNCGNGPDELLPVVEKMHAARPDVTLVAKANAGVPKLVGMDIAYTSSPEDMGAFAARFRAAGARLVGACCGSTPEHIAAMASSVRG